MQFSVVLHINVTLWVFLSIKVAPKSAIRCHKLLPAISGCDPLCGSCFVSGGLLALQNSTIALHLPIQNQSGKYLQLPSTCFMFQAMEIGKKNLQNCHIKKYKKGENDDEFPNAWGIWVGKMCFPCSNRKVYAKTKNRTCEKLFLPAWDFPTLTVKTVWTIAPHPHDKRSALTLVQRLGMAMVRQAVLQVSNDGHLRGLPLILKWPVMAWIHPWKTIWWCGVPHFLATFNEKPHRFHRFHSPAKAFSSKKASTHASTWVAAGNRETEPGKIYSIYSSEDPRIESMSYGRKMVTIHWGIWK